MTHPDRFETPADAMHHAIELARRGLGRVEPNPAVGAVLVNPDSKFLAHGFHEEFGGPHAEVNALSDLTRRVSDSQEQQRLLANATLYVTLEPCCHHGKTPPCTEAIVRSGIPRVVYGLGDPSPHVAGGGELQLTEAGVQVTSGLLRDDVAALNAPYLHLLNNGRPWVHAKWAMTLDGRIAAHSGASMTLC